MLPLPVPNLCYTRFDSTFDVPSSLSFPLSKVSEKNFPIYEREREGEPSVSVGEYYFAGRTRPSPFPSFLLFTNIRVSILPSCLLLRVTTSCSKRNMKISTDLSESSRAFRFGFRPVLVNFISFRYEIEASQRDGKTIRS